MSSALNSFRLDGRIVLITGASSGLGMHFATLLATAGARVADETGARFVEADVSDPDWVTGAFSSAATALGGFGVSGVTDIAIVGVPEPMSIAMLGFGLVGLAPPIALGQAVEHLVARRLALKVARDVLHHQHKATERARSSSRGDSAL